LELHASMNDLAGEIESEDSLLGDEQGTRHYKQGSDVHGRWMGIARPDLRLAQAAACRHHRWDGRVGWTGLFESVARPTIWIARLEITSFLFMLVWVPEHLCHG
jgi:hypothetical protein